MTGQRGDQTASGDRLFGEDIPGWLLGMHGRLALTLDDVLPVEQAISRVRWQPVPAPSEREERGLAALFDGARLTLARHLAGLRKTELAGLVGVSPAAVSAWESRRKHPTVASVFRLAEELGVRPGFFAVWPRKLTLTRRQAHIRAPRAVTQVMRDQAGAYADLALDVAAMIERHVPLPAAPVVPAPSASPDQPAWAAAEIRKLWGLSGPVGRLMRAAEDHGVLVVFGHPHAAQVGTFSLGTAERQVVVLDPSVTDYYTQRWELAVQLGHLAMHDGSGTIGAAEDARAQEFAAELLLPAEDLREVLPDAMGGDVWQRLAQLKELWGVGIRQLLHRARQLGRLSHISHRNAMTTMTTSGWREHEPGKMTVSERPAMLPLAVVNALAEGVAPGELLGHTGIPPHLFFMITAQTPVRGLSTDRVRSLLRPPDEDERPG
jgi:Zn-dependent peptidase ImmA (M78 family)/transcriptional regulator with XRE-family HTH domain